MKNWRMSKKVLSAGNEDSDRRKEGKGSSWGADPENLVAAASLLSKIVWMGSKFPQPSSSCKYVTPKDSSLISCPGLEDLSEVNRWSFIGLKVPFCSYQEKSQLGSSLDHRREKEKWTAVDSLRLKISGMRLLLLTPSPESWLSVEVAFPFRAKL